MIPKIVGASLIVAACGGMGLAKAAAHRRKERMLQQLIQALQAMSAELQYRLTPLPQLMRLAASQCGHSLGDFFDYAAEEMDRQVTADAQGCIQIAADQKDLPAAIRDKLMLLGKSLGRYDLQGQLSGLEAVGQLCRRELDGLLMNRDARLRSYTTLGLCAGIALVILFI